MLAALSVAEPSDEPVSLSAREIKVPKPRQICNLNDHGTASFQQKHPKANRARWCVKEICYGRDITPRGPGAVAGASLLYRIRLLVGSSFPRDGARTSRCDVSTVTNFFDTPTRAVS